MKKLDIAMKLVGCLVAALILIGLVNPAMLSASMPFIIAGTAILLALYVAKAFKTRNMSGMITTLALAAFVAAIICYNHFK